MVRFLSASTLAVVFAVNLAAQQPVTRAGQATGGAHPDLSGTWVLAQRVASEVDLKVRQGGRETINKVDRSALASTRPVDVPGALRWQSAPSYKPELRAKVKDLYDHQSKTDPVFYCGRPGIPRVGPPRRIVQLRDEVILLYEDQSGDFYRVIPTDGRKHREDANPSYYGDSVGHWEGNTLVVDARNFVEEGWFGEGGYFHTDALRVIERFWRSGDNLVYQATVEDANVLTEPWTLAPRIVKRSTLPLEESPPCKDDDAQRLSNDDHHEQR